ncbi:MAG: D-alanine--poly(phosphoribitol) ligase [Clostridia bacterium]|nr:D-alanine--poly(phosphoribitol) ligase [Clostridia bacterium]MCI8979711.1 D-alanine--poly(phosphoribitol) ligase [Clostridia bacterium]MCI9085402.1 D-alanine--poly(phosphoribitol) ligase [Clostridia bacterium]
MVHLNSAVRLLDKAAEKYNDKTAIADEWGEISFAELQKQGKSVGTAIINADAEGYMPSPVMVYLKKSISCIVCFMGAMYSANPYVPTAYDMPANRIQKIVDSLQGRGHIITDANGLETLKTMDIPETISIHIYEEIIKTEADNVLVEKTLSSAIDTDPIYIMFTSGSTGAPKGVTVPHRGVIDYAMWVAKTFGIDKTSVLGNQAPFYFDNSIFDIYSCLLTGAKMVIIPETLFMFPVKLPEFVRDNDITTIFWVPTVMINVANSGILSEIELPKLENVVFCGEVMPNTQLNIWRKAQPHCTYANLYGPTEISDVCTYYIADRPFKDSDPLPIGRACENMRIIILNEQNEIAKTNEQGEICVIGTGVSLGYWNNPEITQKAFMQNPVNTYYEERIYRTGDLAFIDDEGLIIYLGRKDNQVKVKGNRIELGEIENAAMCVDGVKGACAVFDEDKQQIVLFVESQTDFKLRKMNLELKKYIPNYMLPSGLIVMDKFPHTANDKIDRVTLKNSLKTEA